MVHKFLHDSRAVGGSKGYNTGSIEAIGCFEGQYVLGLFFDSNIVVSFLEIKFAE